MTHLVKRYFLMELLMMNCNSSG
ncbi:hypothetical protein NC653_011331 [Populus alba x Populus x berolinensis]|uniref:Uncharacterized protein n=1 Tax=Populus alba x Populus x berolinensis TaxID=444605 RepID=A0AAD6R282_9ROSI|nr:hypothetical protein NC653_011331 [Populus alba x Populus x berolinensis]